MQYPVTLALIAVTALVSWLAFKDRRLADRLILWPPAISERREYWRLVSYGFLHADLPHLLFNMVTLFFFGQHIERMMVQLTGSALTYPLFYLAALVVSILPSYLRNQGNRRYFSLGASGAVSAVLFAFILLSPWSRIFVFFIPAPAILYAVFYVGYSIWMDRRGGDHINHSAHLAGAAFGIMFMLAMEPRLAQVFLDQLLNPRFG
ncbi:MAG: rhomboid family intramembrane serine protease [Xanthomonadaceae bacterium]|nr:rhomboid family intramembrane serine protease [Xanthomonadaceae bacterium]